MKLATKLIFAIVLVVLLLVVVDAYMSIRYQRDVVLADMKRDGFLIGYAMKGLVTEVWRTGGEDRAMELIREANTEEHQIQIQWIWLENAEGDGHQPLVPRRDLKGLMGRNALSFTIADEASTNYCVTYVPIQEGSGRPGALELSEPLSDVRKFTRTAILKVIILTAVLMSGSGFVVVILGAVFVGRPLNRLIDKTRHISRGDFSGSLRLKGHDELMELAEALNVMCDRLVAAREKVREETAAKIAALEQLRHADRLKTAGEVASGIAHELGSPLNVISARAKLIHAGNLTESERQENADIIRSQSELMAETIRQLLDFARRRTPHKALVDLWTLAGQAVDLLSPLADQQEVELRLAAHADPAVVEADKGQIHQVLANLITNAIQAMPNGGRVEISVHLRRKPPRADDKAYDGEYVCLSVWDEGQGISEENIGCVFEPFFTTKDIGEGTGLGLSVAYGIVREHAGWIDVESEQGKGSRFFVYLPVAGSR